MNRLLFLFLLLLFLLSEMTVTMGASLKSVYEPTPACDGYRSISTTEIENALKNLHVAPRLLLTDEKVDEIRKKIESDVYLRGFYESLSQRSSIKMASKPVKRELEGKRLLAVSREALARIFTWSFMYRYTGDRRYAVRVEEEELAIACFSDWNPSHFLDVAEMSTAMAIGYDSCKEVFSSENRIKIREAIYSKGALESLIVKRGWKRNTANWNQVCWCGALYAALAIVDEYEGEKRENLVRLIQDSINGITWAASSYEPDGNYTEGPGYWGYGTGFNIMLIGALESALGEDFGRSDFPGFLASIHYFEHVFGTTGYAFNYPDSGSGRMFESAAFWYASKLNLPTVVWNELKTLQNAELLLRGEGDRNGRSYDSIVCDRLAVCVLLWGGVHSISEEGDLNPPSKLGYVGTGNGRCCVALFRTAWEHEAAYLGIKCGEPRAPHGHLDEGSFVYDDAGVRWVLELGPENYHSIESRGMNLWDMSQDSDRWLLLRYNNYGHSVPTINGALQLVDGLTFFTETRLGSKGEDSYAVIDLTPVYRNEAANVTRKATLHSDGSLVIEDTFEALSDKAAVVERRFLTPARVDILDDMVQLSLPSDTVQGTTLVKRLITNSNLSIERIVYPCETDKEYDSKNPGVSVLIEKASIDPGKKAVFTTSFSTVEKK